MLKTVSSITNAIGALNYVGTWNASTNTPTLVSSVGTKGDYYQVSVAGSTSINGISNWGVGDVIAFNGSTWQRIEGGADLNGVNLSVSNNATFSALTGYVKANGAAVATASATIPNTDVSGLGSMSTQAANSVAITGGSVNGVSIGGTTAATIINVDNIRLDGNTIQAQDTNGSISVLPNGSGFTKVKLETKLSASGDVIINNAAPQATITSISLTPGTWLLTGNVTGVVSSGVGTVSNTQVYAINDAASIPAWNVTTGTSAKTYYPQTVNGFDAANPSLAFQVTIASNKTYYLYGGADSISSSLNAALRGILSAVKISE